MCVCVCVPSTGSFFVCFRPHWRTNYACFMCDSEEGTHQCTQIRGVCCTPRREPACLMVPKICQEFPSVKKCATQRGLFVVVLCRYYVAKGGCFCIAVASLMFRTWPFYPLLVSEWIILILTHFLLHSATVNPLQNRWYKCDITSIQLDCFCWPSELHSLKVTAKAREKKHHLPQKNISNENSNHWNFRTNFRWLHFKEC